jgi:hypothetical protein
MLARMEIMKTAFERERERESDREIERRERELLAWLSMATVFWSWIVTKSCPI